MTTLAKYKPAFENNFINIFDNLLDDSNLFNWDRGINSGVPHYDIVENKDNYSLDFMLAGFNKDDVSINIEKDTLTIEGERKTKEDGKYNYKGSFYGKFKKSFTLPENIIVDKIRASFENGVLSLKIPKDEKAKLSKMIKIE